jgi:hypothetical protein
VSAYRRLDVSGESTKGDDEGRDDEGTGQISSGKPDFYYTFIICCVDLALCYAFPASQGRGSGLLPLHL